MSRELWNSWYCEENFNLIRYLRSIKYGSVTVEVHEKIPVKIKEAFKIKKLKNAGNTQELSKSFTE